MSLPRCRESSAYVKRIGIHCEVMDSPASMPPPLDLYEFRVRARALFGEVHAHLVKMSCDSVGDRLYAVRLHFQAALAEMKNVIEPDAEISEAFALILGGLSQEEWDKFSHHRANASAHALACLESLHAVADTLAHLVWLVVGHKLTGDPLRAIDVSLAKMIGKISDPPIHDSLKHFATHPDRRYLSDVVNHAKHRAIVRIAYGVNSTDGAGAHGLRLLGFERDDRKHEDRWFAPFVRTEYDRTVAAVLTVCAHLSRFMQLMLDTPSLTLVPVTLASGVDPASPGE